MFVQGNVKAAKKRKRKHTEMESSSQQSENKPVTPITINPKDGHEIKMYVTTFSEKRTSANFGDFFLE